MIRILACVVFIGSFVASSAQHGLRLQNSYFISGQPLFGLGYTFDGAGKFSGGIHLEFGSYLQQRHDYVNASQTAYSITGLAVMPELRYYLKARKEEAPHLEGLFLVGFGHVRRMNEYMGSVRELAVYSRRGSSFGGGLALGYRRTGQALPVYAEVLLGYGRADAVWATDEIRTDLRSRASSYDSATTLYRLELAVGYLFR